MKTQIIITFNGISRSEQIGNLLVFYNETEDVIYTCLNTDIVQYTIDEVVIPDINDVYEVKRPHVNVRREPKIVNNIVGKLERGDIIISNDPTVATNGVEWVKIGRGKFCGFYAAYKLNGYELMTKRDG